MDYKQESVDVAEQVLDERRRQDEKWGEQNHPSFPPFSTWPFRFNRLALQLKEANDRFDKEGKLTWQDILLEEVYEALAETDPDYREAELIQVAAVAMAEVECIRRERIREWTERVF